MQRHDKTKSIYDSLFSPISYGFKAADVLFCLLLFLTLINLHTMCVSLVNLLKLPVLSDQLLCDVLSVWVCHALVLPSVQCHSDPCAYKAMTVSCP